MVNKILKIFITTVVIQASLIASVSVTRAQQFSRPQLDSLVKLSMSPITYDQSGISGDGLAWLISQAEESQYFLIGERHGSAEIPQITARLYKELSTIGYDYAALEFGRVASMKVRELLASGSDNLNRFLSKEGNAKSIAFLDWNEEAEMVKNIAQASPKKHKAILGLDHEFIHGAGMYLEMLEARLQNADQKQIIQSLKSSLDENPFLLGSEIKVRLISLEALCKGKPEALEIIKHLKHANYIYGRFRGEITRIESNSYRENLMKTNLLEYLRQPEIAQSKMLFKFGGFHSAPSINQGVSTLGNFVEEWALAHGQKAFNLYLDGISGRIKGSGQNAVNGDDADIDVVSFFGSIHKSEYEHPFSNLLKGQSGPVLIDLQVLRKHIDRLSFLHPRAKSLINAFDAYLAIPDLTPASTIK